jgi:hypothetical protein
MMAWVLLEADAAIASRLVSRQAKSLICTRQYLGRAKRLSTPVGYHKGERTHPQAFGPGLSYSKCGLIIRSYVSSVLPRCARTRLMKILG